MKQKRTYVTLLLVVALLCLGIAYAAITADVLKINGTATAEPSDSNFVVKFTEDDSDIFVSDATKVEAVYTDATNATINVKNLTAKGDKVTATYTIENESPDLSASLTAKTTNSNTDYFDVAYEFVDGTVEANGTETVTVTVTMVKTPISGSVTSNIGVEITASPIQPDVNDPEVPI